MAMYNEITVTAELTNTEYMITKNYNLLENKPQINSVELTGNKSLEDLGINPDAEENVIDVVKVNGSALTPDEEKAVNVTVTTGTANGTVKVNGSDVAVKGLKSAAFTESTAYDAAGSAAEVQGNVDALTVVVNGKVDKVQGKGLSQNDFTNAYKSKLDGIEAGAQVNTVTSVAGKTGAVTLQKSDVGLGNVDNTSDLNKPISTATQTALDGKVDKVEGKGLSTEDFTAEEKTKLAGIEDGAEVNVQADWNQTDVNADDYIKNKPEIGDAAYAEHLALTTPINNNAPYLFRAFPVRNAFKENLKSIVGGSVVWNQLVQNGNFDGKTNWSTDAGYFEVADNIATFIPNTTTNKLHQFGFTPIVGHKYLIRADVKATDSNSIPALFSFFNTSETISKITTNVTNWNTIYQFVSVTNLYSTPQIQFRNQGSSASDRTLYIRKVNCFDLTAFFGSSTIADYIYSLEQATAGSGVAYFRSLFPKDYYAYNAGQLMSVKALSHKTVGFNQFDKDSLEFGYIDNYGNDVASNDAKRSQYIPVLPNTTYYFKTNCNAYWYDGNKEFISRTSPNNTIRTSPNNACYLRVWHTISDGFDTDCINLHWDGERDGEYEAYSEHIYPLDSDLELRGIPKLDANNNLYYDGDTYESDGTVTRKYGIIDLSTINWYTSTPNRATTRIDIKYPASTAILANTVTSKPYEQILPTGNLSKEGQYAILRVGGTSSNLYFYYNGTLPSGYLVYELETPTTETADTFQNLQIVDDFGTEEFVDNRDVPIPVGNDTDFTQEIHIASLPTADGTYNATLTMSNGIATMSFVSTS